MYSLDTENEGHILSECLYVGNCAKKYWCVVGKVLWDKTAFTDAVVWKSAKQDTGPSESGIMYMFCKSWAKLTS